MKLYRNAIILVVILGLLTGTYVYLVKHKKPSTDSSAADSSQAISILQVASDKVTQVTVENKDGKFVFVKNGTAWKAAYPENFNASTSKVADIVNNMSALTADKVIEDNASDLTKYGLNSPATITLQMSDGTAKAVQIGDETPTKSGYYLKEKDKNKVYVISTYTGQELNPSKNDLRNKLLFTDDSSSITGLSLEKGGKEVFTTKKLDKDQWALTSPVEANADSSKLDPIINVITASNLNEFVEENAADLDKYGLKSPAYGLTVQTAKGNFKLLLGDEKIKGTTMYAMYDGTNEVFTVDESLFNFIDKPLNEIMEIFAYIVDIGDVSKIVVDMDGQTTTSEILTDKDGNKDNDKFTVNGKDANMKDASDMSYFRNYYQSLIGVVMSGTEPGAAPQGKAEITITYTLKKAPGTMKVEYMPRDGSSYYVVKNGKYSGMVVSKAEFDKPDGGIRVAYKALMEQIAKAK